MSVESESQVIIPVVGSCRQNFDASMVALRTCRATTSAKMLIIGNNCTEEYRHDFEVTCEALGCEWRFVPGPFNCPKTFNDGLDSTTGPFVAMAGCDTIFYPAWFSNLIRLWQQNPGFFALAPISFHPRIPHLRQYVTGPENRILEEHAHCPGCQVFKRSNGYRYDEQAGWEIDSDLHQYIMRNQLREGVCLNSRVDHVGQIRETLPPRVWKTPAHFDCHDYFMKKWGLT